MDNQTIIVNEDNDKKYRDTISSNKKKKDNLEESTETNEVLEYITE